MKKSKPLIDKSVKNRKLKYDFPTLKNEFFGSEIDEVKAFFQSKFGSYNQHIQKQTAGWTKEKQERKRLIAEEVNRQVFSEEVKSKANALRKVLNSFMEDFKDKIDPKTKKIVYRFQDLPVKIRILLWEVWRIENNLPTSLSKFQNLPGPPQPTALDEYSRKILEENGINPEDTVK